MARIACVPFFVAYVVCFYRLITDKFPEPWVGVKFLHSGFPPP